MNSSMGNQDDKDSKQETEEVQLRIAWQYRRYIKSKQKAAAAVNSSSSSRYLCQDPTCASVTLLLCCYIDMAQSIAQWLDFFDMYAFICNASARPKSCRVTQSMWPSLSLVNHQYNVLTSPARHDLLHTCKHVHM